MDADADAQRVPEFLRPATGSTRRVARTCSRAAVSASRQPEVGCRLDPEERHHAVADELSTRPPARSTASPMAAKYAVQHEHDVVGQPALRQSGEATDIGKQHGNFPLTSQTKIDAAEQRHSRARTAAAAASLRPLISAGVDKRDERCRWRLCAAEPALRVRRAAALPAATLYPNAAGRAAATSATDGGVRDAGDPACLQHAGTRHHID